MFHFVPMCRYFKLKGVEFAFQLSKHCIDRPQNWWNIILLPFYSQWTQEGELRSCLATKLHALSTSSPVSQAVPREYVSMQSNCRDFEFLLIAAHHLTLNDTSLSNSDAELLPSLRRMQKQW